MFWFIQQTNRQHHTPFLRFPKSKFCRSERREREISLLEGWRSSISVNSPLNRVFSFTIRKQTYFDRMTKGIGIFIAYAKKWCGSTISTIFNFYFWQPGLREFYTSMTWQAKGKVNTFPGEINSIIKITGYTFFRTKAPFGGKIGKKIELFGKIERTEVIHFSRDEKKLWLKKYEELLENILTPTSTQIYWT